MRHGVLLVTYGRLGHHMLECMKDMFGELPVPTDVLEVRRVQNHDLLIAQGTKLIECLRQAAGPDAGVLLLTDAFGSTPSNIASKLGAQHGWPVVAGLNLPMLVRVFNYPDTPLEELAGMAVEGARRGILLCRNS